MHITLEATKNNREKYSYQKVTQTYISCDIKGSTIRMSVKHVKSCILCNKRLSSAKKKKKKKKKIKQIERTKKGEDKLKNLRV